MHDTLDLQVEFLEATKADLVDLVLALTTGGKFALIDVYDPTAEWVTLDLTRFLGHPLFRELPGGVDTVPLPITVEQTATLREVLRLANALGVPAPARTFGPGGILVCATGDQPVDQLTAEDALAELIELAGCGQISSTDPAKELPLGYRVGTYAGRALQAGADRDRILALTNRALDNTPQAPTPSPRSEQLEAGADR